MRKSTILYLVAALTSAACAEATRDFTPAPDESTGTGDQTSSSVSGMGGQPGAGGAGMGGKPGTGGQPGAGGGSTATHVGGAGGIGGAGGNAGNAGNAGTGGTGGQGETCIWIDITMNDCSSGIKIADYCPAGRKVNQLERCDSTLYTPDAAYQQYKLSGCPDVCPVVGDHVSWRRIECCM